MSTASPVALLAGLGNPGSRYADTRHNVGHWFIELLQRQYPVSFKLEKKFKAETGHFQFEERTIRVVVPNTFMNLSGQSIAPMASFYRIPPEQILIVHDELDLPPGSIRLKAGGGHGGHNGLRDISRRLGTGNYQRLRIGIGHPGSERDVSGYVLSRPDFADKKLIEESMDRALSSLPLVLAGNMQEAMNQLHGPTTTSKQASDSRLF